MGAGYTGEERGGRSATELACDASAGIAVGVIVATFVCPLDVIKTRLQVYGFPAMQTSGSRGRHCYSSEPTTNSLKRRFEGTLLWPGSCIWPSVGNRLPRPGKSRKLN